MLKSVLIANRGEIACRVIATARYVALGPAGWRVLQRKGVVIRDLEPPVPRVSTRMIWNPARVGRALEVVLAAADRLQERY